MLNTVFSFKSDKKKTVREIKWQMSDCVVVFPLLTGSLNV